MYVIRAYFWKDPTGPSVVIQQSTISNFNVPGANTLFLISLLGAPPSLDSVPLTNPFMWKQRMLIIYSFCTLIHLQFSPHLPYFVTGC